MRLPLGWAGADLRAEHPLDYLGQDGGAGLGSGPGMAVGAALALAGSGRLPVAVLGDGDLLMGGSALWTAAHYGLPLLVVVANNDSFYNDVVHRSGSPPASAPGPEIVDRPGHHRSPAGPARDGPVPRLPGAGQVREPDALPAALAEAVTAARAGNCVLVDVQVRPDNYAVMSN